MPGFEERAAQRRAAAERWPILRHSMRLEPAFDPRDQRSLEERVAAVWELSARAWALTGRPLPDYARGAIPGKLLRRA